MSSIAGSLHAVFGHAVQMSYGGQDIVYHEKDRDDRTITAIVGAARDEDRREGDVRRDRRQTVTVIVNLSESATGGGVAVPTERADKFTVAGVTYVVVAVLRHGETSATLTGAVSDPSRRGRPGER